MKSVIEERLNNNQPRKWLKTLWMFFSIFFQKKLLQIIKWIGKNDYR